MRKRLGMKCLKSLALVKVAGISRIVVAYIGSSPECGRSCVLVVAVQHIKIAVMSRQNEALLEKVILIRGRVRKMIIEAFPNCEIYHNSKK
jgi:hypothetical protein